MELTASEEEGSYDLHIAYTDRAGNTAEFPVMITARVKEEESNSSGSLFSARLLLAMVEGFMIIILAIKSHKRYNFGKYILSGSRHEQTTG